MKDQRDDGGFLGRPAWFWTVGSFLVGLALSAFLAWAHYQNLLAGERQRVARQAERSFQAVNAQLQNCGLLVRSLQALFLATDDVQPDEFQNIYVNLRPRELFPSLQALAVAVPSRGDHGDDGPHFITTLVAPYAGNEGVQGLDVATQPANMRALELSRDTDEPVLSSAFKLVQRDGESGPSDGVTLRLPIYSAGASPVTVGERRQRFIGSLAASFRASKLIETALPLDLREVLDIRIDDVTDGAPVALFHSRPQRATGSPPPAWLDTRLVDEVRYGGRTWRMQVTGSPPSWQILRQPAQTFGIGLLASVLMAFLAWSLASTRARALFLARDMSTQYRDSEARFRALNELLPTLVLLARAGDGRVVYANHAARERLQIPDPEQSHKRLAELFDGEDLEQQIRDVADSGWAMINRPTRLNSGDLRANWAMLSVSLINIDGAPHLLAVASDITELRELNELLAYQASHDALTGLVNRREFESRLQAAIARLDQGVHSAMLYFDVDQFKIINDTSGHFAGDQLLAQLASLLASHLIEGETLARLGGDEFAVLIEGASQASALEFAEHLRQSIEAFEFGWEGRMYAVSVSIGVVMLDRAGMSHGQLLSLADTACYMAKERGRNRVHLYSEQDEEIVRRRTELVWASRLRKALADGRFQLHFQELAPLQPGTAAEGAHIELLIRLRDEDGSMVSPGTFIPAAERYGLMPQLDRWVIQTAFANFARLHPSGRPLRLCAINLSALTAEDDTFAEFVVEQLQQHGVPPERVCFEITETAAVAGMSRVVALMERLRAIGIRFSLDDFGAGMASFGYLKNLPVDYIKIDGSFIRNIDSDAVSLAIARAVTDIGHEFGLLVVAEWVADERARDILRDLGVDYAQGYAVHRPEPVRLA